MVSDSQRTLWLAALILLSGLLFASQGLAQFRAGDTWGVVRGDNSPGFSYSTFVETPSGRWLAAGPGGALMYSDNEGVDWEYDVITDDTGRPLFGNISDMVVHNGRLVATIVSFKGSVGENGRGGPPLPFVGRTRILTSANNGDSWTVRDFPIPFALLEGPLTDIPVPGIFLPHLFVTPAGDLLAYGTTAQSTGAWALFLGGIIYRQVGSSWAQEAFELGVLQSMDVGRNGELIASGFKTLLQSDNGTFWNGYSMVDGNFSLNGSPLDFEEKGLLNDSDIAYINGNYVLQTQQFRRSRNNPTIVVAANQRSVIFQSPDAFAPSRNWTGTRVNRIWPRWINMGTRLLSVVDAAWTSSNGVAWNNVDASVQPLSLSTGRVGQQGVVAVGSGDEVWTSDDAGQSWSKILDQDPGSDLFIRGKVNDVLLAVGEGQGSGRDSLYRSVDNGVTWVEAVGLDEVALSDTVGFPAVSGGRVYLNAGFSDRIIVSEDTGLSWQELPIPTTSSVGLSNVVVGSGGRLIVPQATFSNNIHLSDDGGATWTSRDSPLSAGVGNILKRGIHVGGGRIIYILNQGVGGFSPKLFTSNDNGQSWQFEDPFQDIEGLANVAGSDVRTIDLQIIFQSKQGTVILTGGDGELLVSRDRGRTFELKLFLEQQEEDFLRWRLADVLESDGRLVAIAFRDSVRSSSFRVNFAYISEDEGESWRPVEIPTNEGRAAFLSGIVGADGRLVISGSNGAVYVSDPSEIDEDQVRNVSVREAESVMVDVHPPPVPGEVTVTYTMLPETATGGVDFVQTNGQLTWAEGDNTPKQLAVETIDDPFNEGDETLRIEFSYTDSLIYSWSYQVTIADDELQFALATNVDIEVDGAVRTSENGDSVTFGVALWTNPSEEVTIDLSVDAEDEVSFQPASLTFTADNFKRVQPVPVTGLDDGELDGNRTVQLMFTTASAGPEYDRLAPGIAYIINEDNEVPELIFASGFETSP